MIVLIDNGHGSNTPGKCSPDRSLREYKWAREIAARIETVLKTKGFDARRIVTEETDVPLVTAVVRNIPALICWFTRNFYIIFAEKLQDENYKNSCPVLQSR